MHADQIFRIKPHHGNMIAGAGQAVVTISGGLNYQAVIRRRKTLDCLKLSIYTGEKENVGVAGPVRRAALALPLAETAVQQKDLAVPEVSVTGGHWLTTGVTKRQSIDHRGDVFK